MITARLIGFQDRPIVFSLPLPLSLLGACSEVKLSFVAELTALSSLSDLQDNSLSLRSQGRTFFAGVFLTDWFRGGEAAKGGKVMIVVQDEALSDDVEQWRELPSGPVSGILDMTSVSLAYLESLRGVGGAGKLLPCSGE